MCERPGGDPRVPRSGVHAVKSAVETVDETRVKLTVEVPMVELQPNVDKAYKEIAQQVTIPGFRKGKVPPRIIDQRVGKPVVLEQAIKDRKSTRLNSSHVKISYAVFCLKKKKRKHRCDSI